MDVRDLKSYSWITDTYFWNSQSQTRTSLLNTCPGWVKYWVLCATVLRLVVLNTFNSLKKAISSSFQRWRNQGSESLRNILKITLLINSGPEIHHQGAQIRNTCLLISQRSSYSLFKCPSSVFHVMFFSYSFHYSHSIAHYVLTVMWYSVFCLF